MQIVTIPFTDTDRAAFARVKALVDAGIEWREAEADEWGGLAASLRKDGANVGLIDAIDAITDADLARLAELLEVNR